MNKAGEVDVDETGFVDKIDGVVVAFVQWRCEMYRTRRIAGKIMCVYNFN